MKRFLAAIARSENLELTDLALLVVSLRKFRLSIEAEEPGFTLKEDWEADIGE